MQYLKGSCDGLIDVVFSQVRRVVGIGETPGQVPLGPGAALERVAAAAAGHPAGVGAHHVRHTAPGHLHHPHGICIKLT